MAEDDTPLTAAQLLRLKQLRGLLYIALSDGDLDTLRERIEELDEILVEIEPHV